MINKYHALIDRLVSKMVVSQTTVPGFIMGLSGTDSTIAFLIVYEASKRLDIAHRVMGIHYTGPSKQSWFTRDVIPWLKEKCPKADIRVETPLGGNQDQQRWADLHLRAINDVQVIDGKVEIHPHPPGQNYWVAGTINATEKLLGQYCILAKSVSIQPIQTLYKNEILKLCHILEIPQSAIEHSRIPDCLCGRDELAAKNIDLIDDLLTYKANLSEHPPELIASLMDHIRDLKQANDFKMRIPYTF